MLRCICNLAVRGRENYPVGQDRLMRSVVGGLGNHHGLSFHKSYPLGCPTHQQVPYAFKYNIMKEAMRTYDCVFWLDSSVVALKPIEPLWKIIEERGILAFRNHGCMENQFTSKDCLDALGCSEEDARKICQIHGGVVGYCKHDEKAMRIFDRMVELSSDPRAFAGGDNTSREPNYIAHRHDQSCLSYLLWKENIDVDTSAVLRYSADVLPETILELRGM